MLLLCSMSFAQQKPMYTQYVLNNYIINPAITGIESYFDVKLSSRNQWQGIKGAPQTSYFTIHGPIGKNDYRTNVNTPYETPGENPRGKSYWEDYTASEPHHGVGMQIVSDKTGNFNRFSAAASYAYHVGLSPTTNISAGFAAGITTTRINGNYDFGTDPIDPAVGGVLAQDLKKVKPDLAAGIWVYGKHFFLGLSGQQIIPQKISYASNPLATIDGKLVPHVFITGGRRFILSDDISVLPSVMIKYIKGEFKNNYQAELNTKFQYRDLLWVGGSYRQFDGYAAMLGVNVLNKFSIGYSYDFTDSPLRTYSRGTHELLIGLAIGNKYADKCPRCW